MRLIVPAVGTPIGWLNRSCVDVNDCGVASGAKPLQAPPSGRVMVFVVVLIVIASCDW